VIYEAYQDMKKYSQYLQKKRDFNRAEKYQKEADKKEKWEFEKENKSLYLFSSL